MKKMIELIGDELVRAFEQCSYDSKYAKVSISNRPDLCEYQCNGAMACAKEYRKAPIVIAQEVVEVLKDNDIFDAVEAVAPGFINMKLSGKFVSDYIEGMRTSGKFGMEENKNPQTIIVDYGGANVAKPLHIGHLRSAIIGECVKRMGRFLGNKVIGDVHLGDWGLQMGLIIEELRCRKPELSYFDESFTGEYPKEAPFTISELEEIYPAASKKAKENEEFAKKAHEATLKLQSGDRAFTAIWKHIIAVSVADLKVNYGNLNVEFDLWKGESDAQPYIEDMINDMIAKGYAYESQGATVIDVSLPDDKKEIPPCIIRKSDGAALYATSDLATIIEREKLYSPDRYIYLTDKRQELHFVQVFRAARKTKLVKESTSLEHLGFGTMNGKDGQPFKTRSGGVMRLEYLIKEVNDAVKARLEESGKIVGQEAEDTARIIGLAAIKYGDLSNQASKDYVFDIDRFTSFEGNTGPYILYTIVRIKSILAKFSQENSMSDIGGFKLLPAATAEEKRLMLTLLKFVDVMENAFAEIAPHKICQFVYEVTDAFSTFYNSVKILSEEDTARKQSYIALISYTKEILEAAIDVLGFEAPERM